VATRVLVLLATSELAHCETRHTRKTPSFPIGYKHNHKMDDEATAIDEELRLEAELEMETEAHRHATGKRARDDDDDSDVREEVGLGFDADDGGEAAEGEITRQVEMVQSQDMPFVEGMESDIEGLGEDEVGDGAPDAASESSSEDDDDMGGMGDEEIEQDDIASVPIQPWQLGEGFTSIPPSDSRSAVTSDWCQWSSGMQSSFRACRHLIMQRSLETRDVDPTLCSYKGYSDASRNERVVATAAIEGLMFDTEAKGLYVDGQNLLEQQKLPEDGEKRERAVKSMPPIESYMYSHRYRQEVDDERHIVPGSTQHAPDDPVPNTAIFTYKAPCMLFCVEPVYAKRKPSEDDLPESHPDYDGRGAEVGTRIHKFIFNERYSTAAYMALNMKESNQMHRAGRAMRAANSWRGRNIGPEKAAKQQRAMVANPNVNAFSTMKYARIHNNYSLVHHLNSASGIDSGGQSRNVYTDMQAALGNASLSQPIEDHPTLGSLHALSPEWVFNARDGANPPKKLFPADKYPDMERRPDPQNAVGRSFVSFMTSMDGMVIDIDPKQTNPNNYMDDNGCIVFPYPQEVQMLCNYQVPLRDATLPLVLSLGAPIGDNALDAFWTVNKNTEAVIDAESAALRDASNRYMVANRMNPDDVTNRTTVEGQLRAQGRPSFQDIKPRLVHLFDIKMRPDQESASVRRMKNSKMVMQDSLDPTPTDGLGIGAGFNQEETTTRRVKLATEETAKAIRAVHKMIDEAFALKCARSAIEKQKAKDWFPFAKREAIDWGLRMLRSTYENPKHVNAVYPVARSIWISTFEAIRKAPSIFTHAKVDDSHPRRNNGSINLAFGFNKTLEFSDLSPYGHYMRLLTKVYTKVTGMQGRVLAGRWALHYASMSPVGPAGFKPMIMRNGARGLNKSGECMAFQYIFNSSWCPEIECSWWQMTGEGSAQSLRAGGISGTSGGVAWADEALRSISSGGLTNDPQAMEKLQDMKQLATQGFLSRPRPYKVSTATGPGGTIVEAFRTINDITLDSTVRVMASNTGCNAAYKPKNGPPPRPDGERKALIDRTYSIPAIEKAHNQCMSEAEFKATVKREEQLMWTHTLMTRLTYMLVDCVCLVPEWQASNEQAALDAWGMLDAYMNNNFDIPIPEPRRQTHRRTIAIIKSVERALASYMFVKEEAAAFSEMLPTSSPFEQSADSDSCVHTLAPFDIGQLVNVISTLVYDQEVILDAFSLAFDSNLWTTNELHHILVRMSSQHGVEIPSSSYLHSGIVEGKALPRTGVELQPRPQDEAGSSSNVQTFTAMINGAFDPGAPLPAPAPAVRLPRIDFTHFPHRDKQRSSKTQATLQTCQRFFERRRQILMEFLRKAQNATVVTPGGFDQNSVSSKVEFVMATHAEERDGSRTVCCRLDDGSVETLRAVQDMVLITSGEVTSCGYDKQDVINWLKGKASHTTFNAQEGENIFLGVKPVSWSFMRRIDVERSTENVYDPAWRTTCVSSSSTVVGTPVQSGESAEAGVAEGGQSVTEGRLVGRGGGGGGGGGGPPSDNQVDRHIWSQSEECAKHLSGKYGFDLEPSQIFDRLIQIVDCTRDNYRRIQLTPETPHETRCIPELAKAGTTLMRKFPENFSSDMACKKNETVEEDLGRDSMVQSGVATTQQILPFPAVSFANTLQRDGETRLHKSRRPREWLKFDGGCDDVYNQLKADDICQRRLDMLIDLQALPAAVPLMSTKVAIDCPLRVVKNSLYINSAFAVNLMRMDYEMEQYFRTVPGLRLQMVGAEDGAKETQPPTADDEDAEDDQSDGNRSSDACEQVPADSEQRVPSTRAASSDLGDSNHVVTKCIKTTAATILDRGDTTFCALDVENCINEIRYHTRHSKRLFDQAPLFFTLKLHELFNYYDPLIVKHLCDRFPSVFPTESCVVRSLPETITRFYEDENAHVVDAVVKHDVTLSHKLISSKKKFEHTVAASNNKSKRHKRTFTQHELAKIRDSHREETREDIVDLEKLRSMAEAQISSKRGNNASACDRGQWRQNAIEKKVQCGMIHPRGALKLVVADAGIGLLSKVRAHYAIHTDQECPDAGMKKAIAFLRPYRPPVCRGTCAGHERDIVEITLLQALDAMKNSDFDSEDGDRDGGDDGDADDNIDNLDVIEPLA